MLSISCTRVTRIKFYFLYSIPHKTPESIFPGKHEHTVHIADACLGQCRHAIGDSGYSLHAGIRLFFCSILQYFYW